MLAEYLGRWPAESSDSRHEVESIDTLKEVFPRDVRASFQSCRQPEPWEKERLAVLEVGGPMPSSEWPQRRWRWLRARKAAWEAYLDAAFQCGLFEGTSGKELRARLTGRDESNFRSAIAECLTAWFLAGRLRLPLSPRPEGKGGRTLELLARGDGVDIHVEVKAPHRPITTDTWSGDDGDLLQGALEAANRQFASSMANLLVIVPQLRLRIHEDRTILTRAFFGDYLPAIPLNPDTGKPVGEMFLHFRDSGHLLERHRPGGGPFKPDESPRFTRVGGILLIEETLPHNWIEHEALLVHNPHAERRLPEGIWRDTPQFVPRDGSMLWSDGLSPW